MASDGQPPLWSCLVNLQFNSCGGYQKKCVDTCKLGVAQWFEAQMTASNIVFPGTLPCLQAIHMEVALLNAQSDARAQGGDLEHTGHTFFSTVSANLHIGLVLVHKHGGPRVLLLRGCSSSAPRQGAACRDKPLALLWACLVGHRRIVF